MTKPISQKQKAFVDRFIEIGNATQSYIDAGYSVSKRSVADANARKLFLNPRVKKYLDERVAAKDELKIAKQDEILEFLTSVLRGKECEQIPLGLGMGEQKLADKELDGKDRLKAAELLGKRYGMWLDRQQLEGSAVIQIVDDVPKGGN